MIQPIPTLCIESLDQPASAAQYTLQDGAYEEAAQTDFAMYAFSVARFILPVATRLARFILPVATKLAKCPLPVTVNSSEKYWLNANIPVEFVEKCD